jgi:hypothetical protein
MDAAEDDPRAPLACGSSDLVSSQRVARVNANAQNVAWLNPLQVEMLQSLVADLGIPERR